MQAHIPNPTRHFGTFQGVDRSQGKSRTRLIYGLQLTVALLLLESALWSSNLMQRGVFFWSAMAWILSTSLISGESRSQMGLSLKGLKQTWWLLPCSVALAGAAVIAAWNSGRLHPAFGPQTTASHYFAYALWAVFQQFILQSYFFLRLEPLLGSSRRAVLAGAVLFSVVHIPNALLALATFVGGLLLCEFFRRYRNIYALGLAHAIVGLCIAVTTPSTLNHGMRVGQGFFDYQSSHPSFYSLSTILPGVAGQR
jgi:membrane protease YdiL (CAAX protease family)